MKFLVMILLFSNVSFAQEILATPPLPTEGSAVVPKIVKPEPSAFEEVVENASEVPANIPATPSESTGKMTPGSTSSRENRDSSTGSIMVGYQLLTSWVPSKGTIGYTQIFNDKWSLEGEFATAKIDSPFIGVDIGEIRERRYTLQARRYVGNSFNFTFGPVYSDFKARLGSNVLITNYSSDFSAQNLGLTGGISNRWQWANGISLGVDWLRVNVPILQTKVEDNVLDDITQDNDRDDVKEFIRAFNRIPTFLLFGVNVGYTF